MNRLSLRRLSDTAFTILALVLSVYIGVKTYRVIVEPQRSLPRAREIPGATAGSRLELPPGMRAQADQVIALVALESECPYCQASLPFYQRLGVHRGVRLYALSVDAPGVLENYLRRVHLPVSGVLQRADIRIRVPGTPSLFLVGTGERLLGSWAGQLAPAQESEVFQIVERLVGSQ